jgi:hypothetical protein
VHLPAAAAEATAAAHRTVALLGQGEARTNPEAAGICISEGAEIIAERKSADDG